MSDHTTADGAAAPSASGGKGVLPWIIVGVVSSTIGAAAPFVMTLVTGATSAQTSEAGHAAPTDHGEHGSSNSGHGSGHGAASDAGHGSGQGSGKKGGHGSTGTANTAASNSPMVFIPYGDVTVNLDEQRLNRYLRVKIVLHVRRTDEAAVRSAISEKELLLRSWLVSHLSDKELDDIRGKAGQNMLSREIRDHFNTALFPDHYDRIYEVLFQEFNVQ